jgi:hypothetical protein
MLLLMLSIGFRRDERGLSEAQAPGFKSRLRLRLGVFEPMDNISYYTELHWFPNDDTYTTSITTKSFEV